jgi:hypothetical protein
MAHPVLVGKGFALLGLGLNTYRYTTAREPSTQRPLRLHGLGTPIEMLPDGALFVDERGLTRIRMEGLTVHRERVAAFRLPSTQFFQARLSPGFGEPIVIVNGIILAADGDRDLVAYDIRHPTTRRYAMRCESIASASIKQNHIAIACVNESGGATADRGVTITTVAFPRR